MFEIELIISIKMNLALNNQQRLICHKNPTNQPKIYLIKWNTTGIRTYHFLKEKYQIWPQNDRQTWLTYLSIYLSWIFLVISTNKGQKFFWICEWSGYIHWWFVYRVESCSKTSNTCWLIAEELSISLLQILPNKTFYVLNFEFYIF